MTSRIIRRMFAFFAAVCLSVVFFTGCGEKERIDETTWNGIVELPGGVTLPMVKVEAGGTFRMGLSDENNKLAMEGLRESITLYEEIYEKKVEFQRTVTLKHDYYIGRTEVTQVQWNALMDQNRSYFKGDDLPVETVSWNDAQEFCRKLNELYAGKLPAGYRFDLPTLAQWVYAARGGKNGKGFQYSGSDDVDAVAWCENNAEKKTHPVGTKQPNELGLYDMSGNVYEWCRDWAEFGLPDDLEFLRGNTEGRWGRVNCGGCWHLDLDGCLVYEDVGGASQPDSRSYNIGFRLALVPETPKNKD